jgi:hypothetical protein
VSVSQNAQAWRLLAGVHLAEKPAPKRETCDARVLDILALYRATLWLIRRPPLFIPDVHRTDRPDLPVRAEKTCLRRINRLAKHVTSEPQP